jgi:isocitrate dehydrogenase kinase/phosphatase
MTLDEAIKHCEEVAESKRKQVENGDWEKGSLTERDCLECADEHKQLAEWLKELKQLREQQTCKEDINRQVVKEQMIKYGFHAPDMTVTELSKIYCL